MMCDVKNNTCNKQVHKKVEWVMVTKADIKAYIEALHLQDPRTFDLIIEELVGLGDVTVEPFIDAMTHKCPDIRAGAARALGKLENQKALPVLVYAASNDPDATVRKNAVWALAMGGEKAIKPLINALSDEDAQVRFSAVAILTKLGDLAILALVNTLNHPLMLTRMSAADALGRIGNPVVADALANLLEDPHKAVRQHAALALGRLKDARALYPLLKMVRKGDAELRTKAMRAIGHIRDVRAVDPLIDILYEETDHWLRVFAIESLGRMRDIRATEVLLDMAYDPNHDIRVKALDTLAQIDSVLAADALAYVMDDESLDHNTRHAALFALGKRGDIRACEGLLGLEAEENENVRRVAALLLADIGSTRAIEPLLATLVKGDDDKMAQQALNALVNIGDMNIQKLTQSLQMLQDNAQRLWILRALGEIASPDAMEQLACVMADPDENQMLRDEARSILDRLHSGRSQQISG
jgi:HEAT repeat protein